VQQEQAARVGQFLNIDRSDLVKVVNRERVAAGKPPITPEQIRAAMQEVARKTLRTGEMSEQGLVSAFARHTPLDEREARQAAQRIKDQWDKSAANVMGGLRRAGE
jgi:hypothetical protein